MLRPIFVLLYLVCPKTSCRALCLVMGGIETVQQQDSSPTMHFEDSSPSDRIEVILYCIYMECPKFNHKFVI